MKIRRHCYPKGKLNARNLLHLEGLPSILLLKATSLCDGRASRLREKQLLLTRLYLTFELFGSPVFSCILLYILIQENGGM